MAIICVTDPPYIRDFYHWVLRGHWDGGFNPVDEGFEWNVAGGEINNISIGYPKRTFWYELGNNPDYLSSRKLYYYRAWHTYYDGEELIKIYGEMRQFTAINPNCTGFTNFQAKKMIRKYYSYHGGKMVCNIQPDPGTFLCEPTDVPLGPEQEIRILSDLHIAWDVDGLNYNEVHDSPAGERNTNYIGQEWHYVSGVYKIDRFFLTFTTDIIPEDAFIVRAYLRCLTGYLPGGGGWSIVIKNGMPIWPKSDNPPENYCFDNYSGKGGSAPAVGDAWMIINLNDLGLSMISTTNLTRFALLNSDDDLGIPPTGWGLMSMSRYRQDHQLWVTYQEPL